jgi:hypothetical protein
VEAQRIGKMENVTPHLELFNDISAENALSGFLLSSTNLFLFSCKHSGGFLLNQKEIEAASIMMRIFFVGLALNFDANFHEFEEIIKRALLEVEAEAP